MLRLDIFMILCSVANGFLFFPAAPALERYNVDRAQISVSGISSGAAMASQMHVIHSSNIMGAGLIAGVPFACSGGSAALSVSVCMLTPSAILVSNLVTTTTAGAAVGNIDPVTDMTNDKIYIFNGRADSVVKPEVGTKIEDFYKHFIPSASNVKTVFTINAEHSQPTNNYGGLCDKLNKPDFINDCNYSAAYDLLNFIYGGHLQKPTPTAQPGGELLKFSQEDFFYFSTPGTYSMDTIGYVYVPTACKDKTTSCKLHVAFHGCSMGQKKIGDHYVRHSGYNEVGELNNIIILYPQAISTLNNLQGCWDWWGYTGPLFATKSGFQPTALKRMIDRAANI